MTMAVAIRIAAATIRAPFIVGFTYRSSGEGVNDGEAYADCNAGEELAGGV
ncbi:hypothetical protein [Mesorhizobium sp. WSM3873]|uniref:hypothetical protein n=1 Tax=Mesorhizobium sp. WSM3873 TaxID=1854056 RepID=UPI0012EA4382|nr:hypothetical protein [Mesorhizobium sp. WSM3873]